MIQIENHLGTVGISENYFTKLIGSTVTSCFGVASTVNSNPIQGLRSLIQKKKEFVDKGVAVRSEDGGLVIDLHIVVIYGINISAISQSIINKVQYTIEQATGLAVKKINVYVDDIIAE